MFVVSKNILIASALLCAGLCRAADYSPVETTRMTVYGGNIISNDLPPLAFDFVRRDIQFRQSYFAGLGYEMPVAAPEWVRGVFSSVGIDRITTGLEFIGVRHFGGQHNFEVDVAYMVHGPYGVYGPVKLRAGGGMGPSLALGRPSAEDGPEDAPEKRARFQNFIALELEMTSVEDPDLSFVFRVHHRSGVYGVVAPNGVGSNFLTLGVRKEF